MNRLRKDTVVDPEFQILLSAAEAYFESYDGGRYEYHQCLVLCTASGEQKVYSFRSDSVSELIAMSCAASFPEAPESIRKIVCIWEGGSVDLPAFLLRKKLCEVNPENKNAEILLTAAGGVATVRKISDTIG